MDWRDLVEEHQNPYEESIEIAEVSVREYLGLMIFTSHRLTREKRKEQTKRNSLPSFVLLVACRECGTPGGKYHKSPGPCDRRL